MLAFISLALALLFLLLWKFGVLDELAGRRQASEGEDKGLRDASVEERLEVFQRFLQKLNDEGEGP